MMWKWAGNVKMSRRSQKKTKDVTFGLSIKSYVKAENFYVDKRCDTVFMAM